MGTDHHRLRGAHVADVEASAAANGHRLMAMLSKLARHAHPRLSCCQQDVDGRDISAFTRVFRRAMPGHDVESRHDVNIMHPLLVTALVMAATWDSWRWFVQRIWESPEEAASLA